MQKVHTLQGILGSLHFASGLLKLALKLRPHLIKSSLLSLHLQVRQSNSPDLKQSCCNKTAPAFTHR